MTEVITISNLTKSYPIPRPKDGQQTFAAVKGISFTVKKGEVFGILGPNGAGKTTTLEIIEGLKRQSGGTVTVLGFDNIKQTDEIKKRIGVQLQSSDYLPHLTLGELLDLFASLYSPAASPVVQASDLPLSDNEGKQAEDLHYTDKHTLLKLVGLDDKEHEQVKNLSGGQKQRFTIATSLVNQPEILFLDEPTTGLDPTARRNLWQLIKNINSQGITIVMTTHYMEEAEFLCNRVAIMDDGKILATDEPRKLIERLSETVQIAFFTNAKLDEQLFMNLPGIKKIYNELPKIIIEVESLEKVPAIINQLKNTQIPFSGFTVKTASLEDVYLHLTGRGYQE